MNSDGIGVKRDIIENILALDLKSCSCSQSYTRTPNKLFINDCSICGLITS